MVKTIKQYPRTIQFYILIFLAGLTAIALYITQGAMATNHEVSGWPLYFWIVDWFFWGLRALVEVWVIGYLFSTQGQTKTQRWILYLFEALAITLITLTIGPAIRSIGYRQDLVTSLGEPWFTAWTFGIAAYTSVLIAGTGIAYRIQPDATLDNSNSNMVQSSIDDLRRENEQLRQNLVEQEVRINAQLEVSQLIVLRLIQSLNYLERLNPSQLVTILVCVWNGNKPDSITEIATLLKVSPMTVRTGIERGTKILEAMEKVK